MAATGDGTPSAVLGPAVLATGSTGADPCIDGTTLAAGVHLLWALEPGLGVPVGGYDVARRRHQPPEWVPLSFLQAGLPDGGPIWNDGAFTVTVSPGPVALDDACGTTSGLALAGTARTVTVGFAERDGVAVRASGVGDPPVVEVSGPAAGAGALLARRAASARAGGWSIELWAGGVAGVRITGEDLLLCTLEIGVAAVWEGWEPLTRTPLLLPLVPADTGNTADAVDDRAATVRRARSRLPQALAPEAADRLAGDLAGAPRAALELLLRGGPGTRLPQKSREASQAGGGTGAPRLGLDVTTALALACLDPDVARMLGLSWHDPETSGRWDYRVVAHYGPVRFPGAVVRFDDVPPGVFAGGALRLGGVTVVGSGGLEVLAGPGPDAAGGSSVRVAPPLPGAPAGLILPRGTRSVRLRTAAGGAGGITFTGRRGDRSVVSVTGDAGRLVTLEDPAGIDAVTWTAGPVDLAEVEMAGTAGPVGDQAGYAWNVAATDRTPVGRLTLLDADADADVPRPDPDGRLPRTAGVLGVDWQPADDVRDVGLPVRAQVALSPRGSGATPVADGPFTLVDADRPPPAVTRGRGATGDWPGPDVPRRWTRPVADAGWYAVRVRGVDAFGRFGAWTPERTVHVADAPVPGAPDAMTARYLDPADPALSEADRQLAAGEAGILLGWTWPAGRRLAAPAVERAGEFRVYLHRGDPNLLTGTVSGVVRDGDRSRLRTDLDWPGPPDALAGQLLRVGGVSYPVLGHGSGAGIGVDVAHLASPLSRPGTGPAGITVSPAFGSFVGFAVAGDFALRAAAVPARAAGPTTSTVRTVLPGAGGAEVTLEDRLDLGVEPVTGSAPVRVVEVRAVPGVLVSGGVAHPVLTHADGSAVVRVAAPLGPEGAPVLPAVGDRCTVWTGTAYQVWLPGARLEPGVDEPFAVGFVGVTAADGDPAVDDDPRWDAPGRGGLGARPGREGPAGRAARLAVPHLVAPPPLPVTRPPEVGGDVPAVQADPADWYGRAHWSVPLGPVDGVVGYRVLRAGVAGLFGYDLSLRRAGRAPYADGPFADDPASTSWLAEHHPSVTVADLTADAATQTADVAAEVSATWRDWSAWFRPRLTNRDVMDLADRDTHRQAFRPAHPGTVPGPVFVDTLDGRGAGRFVYRVRTVDASGNAGPWSATLPVVELRDVTPPKPPTLLSVLGQQDAVSLAWRSGTEPDLAGYRIWRAGDAAELADVRRLPAYAEVAADDGAAWTSWDDGQPAALTRWFYRVAAVDRAGNVSAPTPIVSARAVHTAPPEPPTWTRADRDGAGAALAWAVAEDGVTCLVERQRANDRIFTARTGWLTPGPGPREFAWRDDDPGPGTVTYRIRARGATGTEQRYRWNPATVPAVEEGS